MPTPDRRSLLAAWLATTLWLLYVTPGPMYFALDADGGFFIGGAWQQRLTGAWPQIDFLSSYGPLSFELRVLAQRWFGDRPLAEMVLAVVGHGLAFGAFFVAARQASGSTPAATLLLAAGLACLPRYYKFFVVLLPSLACVAGWAHAMRPGVRSAALLGAVTGLAVLFRHDYGVFTGCVAATALLAAPAGEQPRRRLLGMAAATTLAVTAPWVARLLVDGALVRHAIDLVTVTRSYNGGMGLPHPLLSTGKPIATVSFAVVYAMPVAAAIVAWRRRAVLDGRARAQAAVVIVTSTVYLVQSMHRADVGHLLLTCTAALLAAALLWRLAAATWERRLVAALVIACGACGVAYRGHPLRLPGGVLDAWQATLLDRPAWRQRVMAEQPDSPVAAVLRLLSCLPADRAVAVFPFEPQWPYWAERRFAGDTLLVAPGYFESPAHQRRMADGLARDRPLVVLWDEAQAFDNRPERNPVRTHALLHDWVRTNLRAAGAIGGYRLYVDPEVEDASVTACWRP